MNFHDYQKAAIETAVYPNKGANLHYPTLGLCGESGEVAEKVKKIIRDKGGFVDDETRLALVKELGDVLWYVAAICTELDISMQYVAEGNIEKLRDRQRRNQLGGSGDNR